MFQNPIIVFVSIICDIFYYIVEYYFLYMNVGIVSRTILKPCVSLCVEDFILCFSINVFVLKLPHAQQVVLEFSHAR